MLNEAIRDPDELSYRLVDQLPAACGGAVALMDGDHLEVMLEASVQLADIPECIDEGQWITRAYEAIDAHGMVSAADMARAYGVPNEVALAVWWSVTLDWVGWRTLEEGAKRL